MSSSRYPLYNIRKNYYGVWQQVHELGESVTVPGSTSAYSIRLLEIPDNGSVHTKPTISGLTRAEIYPPSTNQFWVNYSTGDLVFSPELEGNNYLVDYWKRGSLIDANDINLLYNRIIEQTTNPTQYDDGYEIGTLWVNKTTNEYFICTNNASDAAIWTERGGGGGTSGTSGTNGSGSGVAEYIHIQETPSETWTIEHNIGVQFVHVEVYDSNNDIIIPYSITAENDNILVIKFLKSITGRALIASGSGAAGTSGTSGTSSIRYKHEQIVVDDIWDITHNLNCKYLIVNVYDMNDVVIIPHEIKAIDENRTTVSFPTSMSGVAVLSF